jgi:glycosyltransferase involved in cell wall biosynthesis
MSYAPNHEGIRWFAERVWPLVRAAQPDARLDVVGKDPPEAVRMLDGRDGIAVHGFVPSMAPYFAGAHAVVVPILTGAGIRVKIVEAMSAGRALVSTTLGWEGLAHLEPGRHLLVADEPQPFADAALTLLGDPGLRERMAAEARALAEREYDWRSLGDRLERVLQDAAGGR